MKKNYIIPMNFMESGYVLNGAVSIRNAIEGAILGVLGFFLCKILPIPEGIDGISYYILICLPLAMVGAYGIQGDPISVFIWSFIMWRRRRKPFFFSNHSVAYTQEAADLLMDAPQFRDYLANALEKVRNNLASEEIVYVEGQTFRFAEDPEQEALRMAQEELQNKRNAEMAEALASAKQEPQKEQPQQPKPMRQTVNQPAQGQESVSASKISAKLVLDNLDWEEED